MCFYPSAIMYSYILKACSIMQEAAFGDQIHDEIVRHGFPRLHVPYPRHPVNLNQAVSMSVGEPTEKKEHKLQNPSLNEKGEEGYCKEEAKH